MKQLYVILILLVSCTNKPTDDAFNEIPVHKGIQIVTSVKTFNNPANIYSSDFISFLAMLQLTQPGNIDTLIYYTSMRSKAFCSKKEIEKYYKVTNLNFRKKLKAIRKLNDTLFLLNYQSYINATQALKTFTVSIEKDTCRLIIEK